MNKLKIYSDKEVLDLIMLCLDKNKIEYSLYKEINSRFCREKIDSNLISLVLEIKDRIIYDLLKAILKRVLNKFKKSTLNISFNDFNINISNEKDIEKLKIFYENNNLKIETKFKPTEAGKIPED